MTDAPDSSLQRRVIVLMTLVIATIIAVAVMKPIHQDPAYHRFADTRSVLGLANGWNVLSNIPFLIVGLAGVALFRRYDPGPLRGAWLTLFSGIALVSAGSGYYHWRPNDATLVWDRLPMTIGFMALFAALVGEYVDERIGRRLLVPLIIIGIASVGWWVWSGDLRPYVWVQFAPLLLIAALALLFRSRYTHHVLLFPAVLLYAVAKVLEAEDRRIFEVTRGALSGHSLKHVVAAAACGAIVLMLRRRAGDAA